MTEPCDLTAVEARRRIGAKELSPVELLESCIARIEQVNPAVNAVVATDYRAARREAKAAEKAVKAGEPLGLLHGLPLGVKDLENTKGLRTTFGSPLFAKNVPGFDDRNVALCREAGAVVVGKTNTPEFGAGANTRNPVYGATGNPFDPKRICGGSSGGSAVALACNMLPICTGSDTGGSLRIPAAFCGVVGFRPSPGLVPHERRLFGWSNLSVRGPMGRTIADVRLMLAAMASDDPHDAFAGPIDRAALMQSEPVDLGTIRAAFSTDLACAPVEKSIAKTFRERTKLFRGAFRSAVDQDPPLGDANEVFEVLRAMQFLAAHAQKYRTDKAKLGPNIIANVEQGLAMKVEDVVQAQMRQTAIYKDFQDFMADVDVLITPTVSVPPFPVEKLYMDVINGKKLRTYFHWLAPTYAITITGHPAISIPCGLEPSGTPFALQLVGRRGADRRLLDIAAAIEAHLARDRRTARPAPDLAKLAKR